MKVVNIAPSISTELLSAFLVKVFPLGPVPLTVYLVTSSSVLSLGSSVLPPSHDSVDSSSLMVVVPGFSEQETRSRRTVRTQKNTVYFFIFFLHIYP